MEKMQFLENDCAEDILCVEREGRGVWTDALQHVWVRRCGGNVLLDEAVKERGVDDALEDVAPGRNPYAKRRPGRRISVYCRASVARCRSAASLLR